MIFDRIALLERGEGPPLTADLLARIAEIRQRYPEWNLPEGEQARFDWWMEVRYGDDNAPHYEHLSKLASVSETVEYLLKPSTPNEDGLGDLADAWRRFTSERPDQALAALDVFALRDDGGPVGLWRASIWGLRDRVSDPSVLEALLKLILRVPASHFSSTVFSKAVAELLQGGAQNAKTSMSETFWAVFDEALKAAHDDPENREPPDNDRWISAAINSSMGYLASAYFSGLFALNLKAGDGIPSNQRKLLDRLICPADTGHRFARVIAASRLPYLYAVDPAWTGANLIPLLDWERSHEEALLAWQGFAWHPRVSEDLFSQLRNSFLSSFTPARLGSLGPSQKTMAQLLVLAGLEFGLPVERARSAIRNMTEEMRAEALWWLWNDLQRTDDDVSGEGRADRRWREKVEPWLSKAWPKDPSLKTRTVGQRFALLPTALDNSFPSAVSFVLPFVAPGDGDFVLRHLQAGGQAQKYPEDCLHLLGAVLADAPVFDSQGAAAMLSRIVEALPALREHPTYRAIRNQLAPFLPQGNIPAG